MSANHNQSIKNALKIVREATKCGVNAIKLQTYTPDTITIRSKRKKNLKLTQVNLYGKVKIYIHYIKKLILRGNGINKYLMKQKK